MLIWFVHFVRLGRPLFLSGGVLFHALGILMALYSGATLHWPVVLWGQLAITSIQLMTHYSNDYFDLAADLANQTPTQWSGGSRILPGGLIAPKWALRTAVFLAGVAVVAIWFVGQLQPAPLTTPLFLMALILAWSYSSPPLRLHSQGLGELTTAILVPGLTPLIGFYLQNGRLTLLPFLVVFPLCCLQFNMLLTINFPDALGDAAAGKQTLVVRYGPLWAARLYLVVLAVAYGLLPGSLWGGLPLETAVAILLLSPLAFWQGWRMWRGDWANPAKWNSLAFTSVALLMGTAVLETIVFFLFLPSILPWLQLIP